MLTPLLALVKPAIIACIAASCALEPAPESEPESLLSAPFDSSPSPPLSLEELQAAITTDMAIAAGIAAKRLSLVLFKVSSSKCSVGCGRSERCTDRWENRDTTWNAGCRQVNATRIRVNGGGSRPRSGR